MTRACPPLAVEDLSVEFRTRSRHGAGARAVSASRSSAARPWRWSAKAVGQVGDRLRRHGHPRRRRRRSRRAASCSAAPTCWRRPSATLAELRGRELAMIFQNPRTALNPIRQVGQQIADVLLRHGGATAPRRAASARSRCWRRCASPIPERRAEAYPFELSGGMCQRVMIAHGARLPAGAADRRRADHRPRRHDPGGDHGPDRRAGARARHGDDADHPRSRPGRRVLRPHRRHACRPRRRDRRRAASCSPHPRHPYTAKLLAATPGETASLAELASIPGGLPDLRRADLPACRYSGRCERVTDDCDEPLPRQRTVGERHVVACWNPL